MGYHKFELYHFFAHLSKLQYFTLEHLTFFGAKGLQVLTILNFELDVGGGLKSLVSLIRVLGNMVENIMPFYLLGLNAYRVCFKAGDL